MLHLKLSWLLHILGMANRTSRKGLTLDKLLLCHAVSAPDVPDERYQEKGIHVHIKQFSCFLILTQRHVCVCFF